MAQNLIDRTPTEEVDRAWVFKQRRLLLGFSFALSAIHGLDVKLSGNVSLQGLILTFERQYMLVIALWFAWLWTLWRYWQYERTYKGERIHTVRRQERETRALRMVQESIRRAIDEGAYKERGVNPGDSVRVSGQTTDRPSSGEWVYGTLHLGKATPQGEQQVAGGANCTLSAEEVRRAHREAEIAIRLRYPYFTDFKAVYWLAALAPTAGLIDLGGWAYRIWRQAV